METIKLSRVWGLGFRYWGYFGIMENEMETVI